jgi:hypothetical protein
MNIPESEKDRKLESGDAMDRILLNEPAILPTSGFAVSVVDAISVIEQQATQAAPIPFPWKLVWPGLAALGVWLIFFVRLAIANFREHGDAPARRVDWEGWQARLHLPPGFDVGIFLRTQAGPVLLALGVSWLCVMLARRMAGISRGFSAR